jgi:addiction module HigA family antidote
MSRTEAHAPIHPGEILLEEFLSPLGISQYRLAATIGVPARRINEIVHGKRSISPGSTFRTVSTWMSHSVVTKRSSPASRRLFRPEAPASLPRTAQSHRSRFVYDTIDAMVPFERW